MERNADGGPHSSFKGAEIFMRLFCSSLVALVLLAVAATGGETKRVSLHRAAAKVEAPEKWRVEEDDDNKTVMLADPEFQLAFLNFLGPNPAVKDMDRYARMVVASLFTMFGSVGAITSVEEKPFKGYPGNFYTFEIPLDPDAGEKLLGQATVFDIHGYVVLFFSWAHQGEAEAFFQRSRGVVDSYEINRDVLERGDKAFREHGESFLRNLEDLFNRPDNRKLLEIAP